MTIHFALKENGTITYSKLGEIQETGTISYHQFEVDEEDVAQVDEGIKDFSIENDKLVIIDSTRKADADEVINSHLEIAEQDQEERDNLKVKLQNGTATDNDIKNALLKLL